MSEWFTFEAFYFSYCRSSEEAILKFTVISCGSRNLREVELSKNIRSSKSAPINKAPESVGKKKRQCIRN